MTSLLRFFLWIEGFYHLLQSGFIAFIVGIPLGIVVGYKYGEFLAYSLQSQMAQRILSCMETYLVSAYLCTQIVK